MHLDRPGPFCYVKRQVADADLNLNKAHLACKCQVADSASTAYVLNKAHMIGLAGNLNFDSRHDSTSTFFLSNCASPQQ